MLIETDTATYAGNAKVLVTFTDGEFVNVALDAKKNTVSAEWNHMDRTFHYTWHADEYDRGETAGSIWFRGGARKWVDLSTLAFPEAPLYDAKVGRSPDRWLNDRTRIILAILFVAGMVVKESAEKIAA